MAVLGQCLGYFTRLWNERQRRAWQRSHLDAAHSPSTQHGAKEFLGNIILLIVGGNDTTRNRYRAGCCFNQNPINTGSCAKTRS